MITKEQKIAKHSLFAQWHMHSASNGHCETRIVWQGDKKLTPDELRDDEMETAMRHIHIIDEIIEMPDEEWNG